MARGAGRSTRACATCSTRGRATFDAAAVELVVDVIAYSLFALGILLATITTLVELYRIMQTAMLSWDTDGDGVVEVHEVRSAIAALCRRRLKRGRAAYHVIDVVHRRRRAHNRLEVRGVGRA